MNDKIQFANELKEKISQKEKIFSIGHWTYSVFLNYKDATDTSFLNLLLDLNTMEDGEEFELSYEELNKIADDLIERELQVDNPSIEKSATILDKTWLMCPDCIDAWESISKNTMVICPKCNQVFHNPRWEESNSD
jgi:hypothetical protein